MVYGSSASSRCAAGPKIAAIGGGTGLSTMLRGLKKYTDRLTAIVTVADDGGGSGVLRREMGILPPGDVRQCMQALANTEPVMEQLLGYRFPEGQLKGQSFGNLLLAALNGMAGSFEEAVAMMGQVLAISGRVLPVTNADVQLEAVFENGTRVVGESHIFNAKKQQDCRIHHVSLVPERPKALPDALRAISEADLILLGLASGLQNAICVQDIGLTGRTAADGLAVSRPSGFVGETVKAIVSGGFTVSDEHLFTDLHALHETERLFVEPSACAGFAGAVELSKMTDYLESSGLGAHWENAAHIVWATGGALVPEGEREKYLAN